MVLFNYEGIEIVNWEKALNKAHLLLQKAKTECVVLNPPLSKSIATRIWHKSTPDLFWNEWTARRIKHREDNS